MVIKLNKKLWIASLIYLMEASHPITDLRRTVGEDSLKLKVSLTKLETPNSISIKSIILLSPIPKHDPNMDRQAPRPFTRLSHQTNNSIIPANSTRLIGKITTRQSARAGQLSIWRIEQTQSLCKAIPMLKLQISNMMTMSTASSLFPTLISNIKSSQPNNTKWH